MDDFSFGSVFTDLFDTAKRVFNRVVDFEFSRKELDIQREIAAFSAAQARDDLERQQSFNTGLGGSSVGGISSGSLLLIGAAGVGAFLLLRR